MRMGYRKTTLIAGCIAAVLGAGAALKGPVMTASPWASKIAQAEIKGDIESAQAEIQLIGGETRKNRLELKQMQRAGVRRDLMSVGATQRNYESRHQVVPPDVLDFKAKLTEEMARLTEQINRMGSQ